MAANRAYVTVTGGPGQQSGGYIFTILYIILASDNSFVKENSINVNFTYNDNNMDQLIVTAIQAQERDSSIQVELIP